MIRKEDISGEVMNSPGIFSVFIFLRVYPLHSYPPIPLFSLAGYDSDVSLLPNPVTRFSEALRLHMNPDIIKKEQSPV